jgi:FAM192A/Fyv6, N-terminal domain
MASTSRETAEKRRPPTGRSAEEVFGSASARPLAASADVNAPLGAIGHLRPGDYSRFVSAGDKVDDEDAGVSAESAEGLPLFELLKAKRERKEEEEADLKKHVHGALLDEADVSFLDEVAQAEREQRDKERRRERDEVEGFYAAKANIIYSVDEDDGDGRPGAAGGADREVVNEENSSRRHGRKGKAALPQLVAIKRRKQNDESDSIAPVVAHVESSSPAHTTQLPSFAAPRVQERLSDRVLQTAPTANDKPTSLIACDYASSSSSAESE